MKSYILFALLFVCSFTAFGKKDTGIYLKSLDLRLVWVPGGNYMSQEITNGQYRAFIDDLLAQGKTEEAFKYRPDSTRWRTELLAYNEPMVEYYFRHPAYSGYPVAAITKEGAEAFCAWLTERIRKEEKLGLPNSACSLPSEEDWISASAPFMDNPYPWYGPYAYNAQGEMLCNVLLDRVDGNTFLRYQGIGSVSFTALPDSYYPNKYGLYNMIGNVAEITCEGYIKGGSWGNTIDECAVNKRQEFTLPNAHVGFRVMLVKDVTAVVYSKGGYR